MESGEIGENRGKSDLGLQPLKTMAKKNSLCKCNKAEVKPRGGQTDKQGEGHETRANKQTNRCCLPSHGSYV